MICVRSSVDEDPAKDYNEWMQHVYRQVKINYQSKLSCTKLDSTSHEEKTL